MITKLASAVIKGKIEKEKEVLSCLYSERAFHIDSAFDQLPEGAVTPTVVADRFALAKSKLSSLEGYLDVEFKPKKTDEEEPSPDEICAEIDSLFNEMSESEERISSLADSINKNTKARAQFSHYRGTDIDFNEIKNMKFFKAVFGTMPRSGYESLHRYQDVADKYFFIVGSYEKNDVWGMYITPQKFAPEVDSLFELLHFKHIELDIDVTADSPDKIISGLDELIEKENEELKKAKIEKETLRKKSIARGGELRSFIDEGEERFGIESRISHDGDEFTLVGWVPAKRAAGLGEKLESLGVSCTTEVVTAADAAGRSETNAIPTLLRNLWVFRPFEDFVKMYGTPSYNEVDPTPLVSITYMIFFGMMFGDLGQGLLIAAVGAVMWFWKKNFLGRILTRVGFSAAVFGLIYGSVFGYEREIIPGIEFSPMARIDDLLMLAVGLGIVIIVTAMFFNVANGIKQRDIDKAVFSSNGIAGIVLYCSVVALILNMMFSLGLPSTVFIITTIISVLLILFRTPILVLFGKSEKPEDGFGSYFIESFFELFEVFLSFFSNTLSYLRVGVFALSHVGMMTVVMMLAGDGKNIAVMIIGNIFVAAFEGMIVCIQALRLEFYEIFSRFYDGGGKEFITYGKNNKNG